MKSKEELRGLKMGTLTALPSSTVWTPKEEKEGGATASR
jgi:hypothetical protein